MSDLNSQSPSMRDRIARCVDASTPATVTRIGWWRKMAGKAIPQEGILISKEPKSRMSLVVYLHEVGHFVHEHDINGDVPVHLMEYQAHKFAFQKAREHNIAVPLLAIQKAKFHVARMIVEDEADGVRIDAAARRFAKDYPCFVMK